MVDYSGELATNGRHRRLFHRSRGFRAAVAPSLPPRPLFGALEQLRSSVLERFDAYRERKGGLDVPLNALTVINFGREQARLLQRQPELQDLIRIMSRAALLKSISPGIDPSRPADPFADYQHARSLIDPYVEIGVVDLLGRQTLAGNHEAAADDTAGYVGKALLIYDVTIAAHSHSQPS